MKKNFFRGGVGVLLFLILTDCHGSGTRNMPLEGGLVNNPGIGGIRLTVNPPSASVEQGGTIQFSASITGTSDTRVVWEVVEGPSCGTISFTGLYTAPSTVPGGGKCHIKATSVADPTKSATAEVTITAPISVSINPPTASVLTGDTLQFSATVSGTSDQRVSWQVVEGPSCGSISSTGLYTAPSTVPEGGKCHIRATSVADPTKSATVEVTITTSVVGCVAPAIPGFSGYEDIYDNESSGQVDGPMGPAGTAEIDIDHAHGIVDDGNNHFFLPDGNGGVRMVDLNVDPPFMSTIIDEDTWSSGGGSSSPKGIALLPNRDIVVSDSGQDVIWKVTQSGQMSLFAGVPGTSGYQDGPATDGGEGNALFDLSDSGLTVDAEGNVLVADDHNCAIRRISNGQVTTIAINPDCAVVTPPEGAIVTSLFEKPTGVAVDCNGNLVVADESTDQIYRIILQGPNTGQVIVVAGIHDAEDSLDHPDPLQASFCEPIAISVDRENNIIVSDHCATFRRIAAGQNVPGADGTAPNGEVTSPLGYGQPGSPLEYIAFTKDGNPVLVINDQRIALTFYEPPPPGVSVVVSPRRVGLDLGEEMQLVALVFGTEDKSVTWSVVETTDCGTVDDDGYYTAPFSLPEGGVCHVRATSVADPTKSGTAEITIRG